MKKLLVSILYILFSVLSVSAQDIMVITRTDNNVPERISVSKIQSISFEKAKENNVIISGISFPSATSCTVQFEVSTEQKIDEVGVTYGSGQSASAYSLVGKLQNTTGTATISNLEYEKTYYVQAYAKIDGQTYTSQIESFTTPSQYQVPEMVDLGLSVKWASHNMGAANEFNTGDFLPWGDITGESYNSSNYPKQNINVNCISGTQYDIATAKWGSDWRLPTAAEFQELWDNTSHGIINNYGSDGYNAMRFTARNGKSIILPLAGFMENLTQYKKNEVGFYWTGDIKEEDNGYPTGYAIQSPTNGYPTAGKKWLGLLIRPVSGANKTPVTPSQQHDYVDLGIVCYWSPVNYGATSETDPGKYLAWGEQSEKSSYNQENYTYYNDGSYNDITTLQANNIDVVAKEWGGKWHMPTYDQFYALINYCTWTYTNMNGVEGYKVSGAPGSGCEKNYIFLPISGVKFGESTLDASEGCYWSGEQYFSKPEWGYFLDFDSSTKYIGGAMKYRGCVIRPCRDR